MKRIALIYDTGPAVGLGHKIRSEVLAQHLKSRGFDVVCRGYESDFGDDYDTVIWDLEKGCPSAQEIEGLRPALQIGFIGAGYKAEGYENLDLAIVQGAIKDTPSGVISGLEYVVLREPFSLPVVDHKGEVRHIFICGGGSDPDDFTSLAVEALSKLAWVRTLNIVVGPWFKGRIFQIGNQVLFEIHDQKQVSLYHHSVEPRPLIDKCELAVVSYGMTALECLARGLPVICGSMSEDHHASAMAANAAGAAIYPAGLTRNLTADGLAQYIGAVVERLDAKTIERKVDGRGAERVTDLICKLLN